MKRTIVLFTTIFTLATIVGCSADAAQQWQSMRQGVRAELIATTQSIGRLKAEVDRLPDGDARRTAEQALADAESLLPTLVARMDHLDTLITSSQSGDATQLGSALGGLLAGVPVIGPYAGLAGLAAGVAWGTYQRLRRRRDLVRLTATADSLRNHLKNVVLSLEQAGPEWTEQDKQQISALQGPATTRIVHELKAPPNDQ